MPTISFAEFSLLRTFHGHGHRHHRIPKHTHFLGYQSRAKHGLRRQGYPRSFSSSSADEKKPSVGTMDSNCWEHSLLQSVMGGLAKHAIGFPVKGENVEVLDSPSQFYNTMKSCIRAANDRIVISALYIGNGPLEQGLLDVVAESLNYNPGLQALLLFDALRSTRIVRSEEGVGLASQLPKFRSSADMLTQKLLADSAKWRSVKGIQHKDRVKVALYRTPNLTKGLEKILPSRLNEVVGVCHMKAYIFDNNVLMSGANLSSSYFTNRQDRYILIRDCQNLADYLCELVETVASFSYALDKDGILQSNAVNIDPRLSPVFFRREMLNALKKLLDCHPNFLSNLGSKYSNMPNLVDFQGRLWLDGHCANTWVFPTMQIGSLGVYQDELCLLWMLVNLPAGSLVHFASAYFNLTKEFQAALIQASTDKLFKIITAAPQANGFYGSKGLSGLIPKAYSLLEKKFYEQTCQQVTEDVFKCNGLQPMVNHKFGIELFEYKRLNWTFHAKGMWCYLPNEGISPSITLIGSSNFGFRSRQRDIEAQLFLVTREPSLRQKLQEETDRLFSHSQQVHHTLFLDPDRSGGRVSSLAAQLIRSWL